MSVKRHAGKTPDGFRMAQVGGPAVPGKTVGKMFGFLFDSAAQESGFRMILSGGGLQIFQRGRGIFFRAFARQDHFAAAAEGVDIALTGCGTEITQCHCRVEGRTVSVRKDLGQQQRRLYGLHRDP